MRKDFNHTTASRLQKWAEKVEVPEEKIYLEKLAQLLEEDPAGQVGLNDTEIEGGLAPGASDFEQNMANVQGDAVDLSTGENPEEEEKGQYDITREPMSPMWNVELLRIKAASAAEAQEIVEKFVGWARNHGQPRISVGTIKRSRDDEDTGNK